MKKGVAMIPLILIVLLVGIGGLFTVRFLFGGSEDNWICQNGDWVKHGNPSTSKPSTPCASSTSGVEQGTTVQPTEQQKQQISSVPLPTEEDIIRTFFNLINEKRIPEAISMMSERTVTNDGVKQSWGVQFNAIKSIKVLSIEPSMKENWTDDYHSYKTSFEVSMSLESANAVIPYYGWDGSPSIKWIGLVKEKGLWKVEGISTGP